MAITNYEIELFGGTGGYQQDRARVTLGINRGDLSEVTVHFRDGALPQDSYTPGRPQHFNTYLPLSLLPTAVQMLLDGKGLDFLDWLPPRPEPRLGVLRLRRALSSRGGAARKPGKAAKKGAARKSRGR